MKVNSRFFLNVKNSMWQSLGILLIVVTAILVLVGHSSTESKVLGLSSQINSDEIVNETNSTRRQNGMAPLMINPKLQRAAEEKVADMFRNNYWAHVSPTGKQPWEFILNQDYSYQTAGENLARDFQTSKGVINGWMQSEGHRKNLLETNYTETGVAVGQGQINGRPSEIVVALYARPLQGAFFQSSEFGGKFSSTNQPISFNALNALAAIKSLSSVYMFALLLCIFLVLFYLVQHIVLKKHKIQWDQAKHKHPLIQASLLAILASYLVITNLGSVL